MSYEVENWLRNPEQGNQSKWEKLTPEEKKELIQKLGKAALNNVGIWNLDIQ
jgi:hypothetical protein